MKLFSYFKGLFRRVSTPKKDEKYVSPPTTYGEYDIDYISGFVAKYNNLRQDNHIFRITYQKGQEDIDKDANQLINILSSLKIIVLKIVTENNIEIFISSNGYKFGALTWFYTNSIELNSNKLFRKFFNGLTKIDEVDKYINLYSKSEAFYHPYETQEILIDAVANPVYIQSIFDEFKHEVDMELITPLLTIVYAYNNDLYCYGLLEFMYHMKNSYEYNKFIPEEVKQKIMYEYYTVYKQNFNIDEFKNVFDINYIVTDQPNDESIAAEIDEIIED